MTLIRLIAISQTTNSSPTKMQDSVVSIPKGQAKKIVLDLEYLRMLKQQDSLLKIDTARFSAISSSKDTINMILQQENTTLNGVIINQKTQLSLLNNEASITKKKTFWLKVERDVAVIALIFVGGYATLKQ
jgi:hypothetical protein